MDIRVRWTPSVSTDVVVQKLAWLINDEVVREVNLIPSTNTRFGSEDGVTFVEGDIVGVTIIVNDGKSDSSPVSAEIQVPLEPPEPITNLVLELVV